jgi:hypothetical protein
MHTECFGLAIFHELFNPIRVAHKYFMLTKLNYTVSQEILQEAAESVPLEEFKSTINEPSGDFFYDSWNIKKEFEGTVWHNILKSLPSNIGEARIIVLKHGNCYQSHGDIDDRYHLNITGQYSYLINLETETMYPQSANGIWYEMDAGPRHSAANFGNSDRVQLVVRKLLSKNNLNSPLGIKLSYAGNNKYGVRFNFDDILSPWLNKANKSQIITDFSYSHNDVRFKIEKSKLSDLEKLLPVDFKIN